MAVRFSNGSIFDGSTGKFYGADSPNAPFVPPEPPPPPKAERPPRNRKVTFSNGAEYDFETQTAKPPKPREVVLPKGSFKGIYQNYLENNYPKVWTSSTTTNYIKKKILDRMEVPEADRPEGVFVLRKGVPEPVLRRLYGAMAA